MTNSSSKLFDNAVEQFSKLPGIGKKSALRLVLFLLSKDSPFVKNFVKSIDTLHTDIRYCETCHHIADDTFCHICSDDFRKKNQICIVENIRDVISIESTQQYSGTYHVLGGLISPIDGIGPEQLKIQSLLDRIQSNQIDEVVFALSPNVSGDTTIFYIQKKIQQLSSKLSITTIARGVSFGGNLEYADEITLGRSIQNRMPIENYLKS